MRPQSKSHAFAICLLVTSAGASCATARPTYAYETRSADEWATTELPEIERGEVALRTLVPTAPAAAPRTSRSSDKDPIEASFAGHARLGPKTSIVKGVRIESFRSLGELTASLPPDAAMQNHQPALASSSMERAPEERRRVKVNAWLYAIKYEADHDWHLILGTDPRNTKAPVYFNAEISGLPPRQSPDYSSLLKARKALAKLLANDLPGEGSYRKYKRPIPVLVEGSLFYDIDHTAGEVGPAGMRPTTSWEVHPITRLEER